MDESTMRSVLILTVALMPGTSTAQNTPQAPAACERLASLSWPDTSITLAQLVNAGGFTVPANPAGRRAQAARLRWRGRSVLCRTCPGE